MKPMAGKVRVSANGRCDNLPTLSKCPPTYHQVQGCGQMDSLAVILKFLTLLQTVSALALPLILKASNPLYSFPSSLKYLISFLLTNS